MRNEDDSQMTATAREMHVPTHREEFDRIIGQTDRCLSEILLLAKRGFENDDADRQTLKHHAQDLIGVGTEILKGQSL